MGGGGSAPSGSDGATDADMVFFSCGHDNWAEAVGDYRAIVTDGT
ncbi:hypothetical protein BH09ACT8_BH09ACT8_50040 [soil metagenome]